MLLDVLLYNKLKGIIMKKENKFIQYIWIVPFLVTLGLLVAHVFSIKKFLVDNTTLLLLCILIISPLSLGLKKIKFGNFEAELMATEAKEIAAETNKAKKDIEQDFETNFAENIIEDIYKLLDEDYIMALVKLRMELENISNKICNRLNQNESIRHLSLRQKVDILFRNEIIDKRIASLLTKVISICNKAVHCEEIKKEDAISVVDNGTWLLSLLYNSIPSSKPIDFKIINNEECNNLHSQKYIVKTVIPYVNSPRENTYIMTQEELNDFLEGYTEYAEFIIEVRQQNNAD